MTLVGVDTGGTFTDFILWRDDRLIVHKVLSTPEAPERAILQGIRELGLAADGLRVIHGSTVATNAVLEGKGVRTVFVTNRGFADVLTIGRQNRQALYDLQPEMPHAPVEASLCLEADTRLDANGVEIRSMTAVELDSLVSAIRHLAPDAVAISLLFSYLDAETEQRLAANLPDDLFVSLSSEILPEAGEYERGVATWLNAWVGPLVDGYLQRLAQRLSGSRVSVMQSSGETVQAEHAGGQAVRMLLSGPAGGLVGARFIGRVADHDRLLTFDMGGTSTDVALIDGETALTTSGAIGRYPVAVPMVDMHTIGAGGGSIAWVDAGGMLQVGPTSAGANPGPACYGLGGSEPTVTDANLVLGRIRADAFLGGAMPLQVVDAEAVLRPLALALGTDNEELAKGIVAVANEHMARALRTISVQRGIDPRRFVLVSFGGAGGLHVCALADALGMREALVPVHGGVLSALGMLVARPGQRLSRSHIKLLVELEQGEAERVFAELAERGLYALSQEGITRDQCNIYRTADLRYRGQSYTLNLPWCLSGELENSFHDLHIERYGHSHDLPVELVNLRVAVVGPEAMMKLPVHNNPVASEYPTDQAGADFVDGIAVYARDSLQCGQVLTGPAVVTEQVATTWVEAGWSARVDAYGNLQLCRTE